MRCSQPGCGNGQATIERFPVVVPPMPPRCIDARASRPLVRIFVLSAILAIAACGGGDPQGQTGGGPGGGPGGAGRGDGDRPIPVTTVRLRPEAFSERITAIGTVKAYESVTITAKVSELVQAVHFESGDDVRVGAPLVTLSDRQQRAALAEAQTNADEAERLFRRQSELAAQQLIARAQLDNQRAVRDAANARVAQIRATLADRVIRAPFSGVLGLRQVSPGALVTPGTPVATLDALARVYVDFPLPETQLSMAQPGRAIEGTATAWPGRTFSGVIDTLDARIDPTTRAVIVRAEVPNGERLLRPGMLVNVQLPGAAREALLVPEIAVVQVGRDSYLFRVDAEDAVERVQVRIGARANGKAEVLEGARAGDRIVVDGTGKLRPGAKIAEAKMGADTSADGKPADGPGPSRDARR